ncbi:MAG: hypothetical protein NC112_02265, partial [Oxalobacter formigenes]|nr:hypothetical protein [Oxalobacter formigenes]
GLFWAILGVILAGFAGVFFPGEAGYWDASGRGSRAGSMIREAGKPILRITAAAMLPGGDVF